MKNTKVIFMGTPDFAVPILKSLVNSVDVTLVVSQPDKEVGRKKELKSTPIKEVAQEFNIEVFQPVKIRTDYQTIVDLKPDLIITCAYGQIIPKELLELPNLGCINVHASLLPSLRGGAPIHHAIIDGYKKTGITIMYMDEKMDTGDMIAQSEVEITNTCTTEELHNILSDMGAKLLVETLPSIINKTNNRTPQNHEEATYAWNIKREEERIDFNKTCQEIYNQVRGLYSWPLANTLINGLETKIIECTYKEQKVLESGLIVDITNDSIGISAKDGIIYVTKIKPFGKKVMLVKDYLNGINKEQLLNIKVGV